jgi:hypothetical protein
MNALEQALRDFLAVRPPNVPIALVGGVAVGARTEPRFTRDLDVAVAVGSDSQAEAYVLSLRRAGYELAAAIEQVKQTRLSTVRLRRGGKGPFVDLLFAASGIEDAIVAAAAPIEIVSGLFLAVAQIGHLIAMKLVARDDRLRPLDQADLLALSKAADEIEWARAATAVRLIEQRGFHRGRDLTSMLADWRERAGT